MENETVKVNDFLKPDGWNYGELLEKSDGFSDGGFPGCQYRVSRQRGDYNLAVNVMVTGKRHFHSGSFRSRCKVEFVGDCEPSTFSGGWVYYNDGKEAV